jgi:hypothetical protein
MKQDIKDYLEKAMAEHWKRLRKSKDFLNGEKEITTEKLLDDMVEKLNKCIEYSERSTQTLDNIIQITNN